MVVDLIDVCVITILAFIFAIRKSVSTIKRRRSMK